jgi:asparagine synthase (glutamine-hydrolysing)
MCGIAGIVDPGHSTEARERAVQLMCAAMIHRGPDDGGIMSDGETTIGMRRLAIFDPNNGHQPMTTPDGRYSIVFNGAIYNFKELQIELESSGWSFRTRCDTEMLLAALAQWGTDALKRLRGMFAFAFWDSFSRSLLLARDPFGIKPLYYRNADGMLIFASELNAMVNSGECNAQIDPDAVSEYLAWLAVPAPRTIYKDVFSLSPGEFLIFDKGEIQIESFWSFASARLGAEPCQTRHEFIVSLRQRLEDSIRAHVISDVPVGAFLSGGLDSAVIAGLMSRVSGNALKTFSIGFEEFDFSEADQAESTARYFGSVHHTRILSGSEVAGDIDKLMSALDQPTGDGVNTYYVSETAQQGGVKVALSGLGGDELFGGYPSFRTLPSLSSKAAIWSRFPLSVRRVLSRALNKGGTRARKFSDMLLHAGNAHEIAALQRRVFSQSSRLSILSEELRNSKALLDPFHPRLKSLRNELEADDPFTMASGWELRTYMADVLLRDSDVMSMRHSIELRVPFIDRPLIEWLWGQPPSFKNDRKTPKGALIEATADLLPPGLSKRRKRGFTFPFPIWMRSDLRPFLGDTFSDSSIESSGFFEKAAVQSLWNRFLSGNDDREWSRVWSLAVLIDFANRRRNAPASA